MMGSWSRGRWRGYWSTGKGNDNGEETKTSFSVFATTKGGMQRAERRERKNKVDFIMMVVGAKDVDQICCFNVWKRPGEEGDRRQKSNDVDQRSLIGAEVSLRPVAKT